jgi:hypothetical protein
MTISRYKTQCGNNSHAYEDRFASVSGRNVTDRKEGTR